MKKENFNLKNICPISINGRFEEFDLIVWRESFQSDVQKEQFFSLSLSQRHTHWLFLSRLCVTPTKKKDNRWSNQHRLTEWYHKLTLSFFFSFSS